MWGGGRGGLGADMRLTIKIMRDTAMAMLMPMAMSRSWPSFMGTDVVVEDIVASVSRVRKRSSYVARSAVGGMAGQMRHMAANQFKNQKS